MTHKLIQKLKYSEKILGDRNRIEQVLFNFISNAIKYSPESDKTIIRTKKRKDHIEVNVQDLGIGISKDMHERIFERFF